MSADPFVDILFGEFRPDFGGAPNPEMPGYLTYATGVRLTPNGYRGMPVFADIANATAIGGATTFWQAAFFENSSVRHFFAFNVSDAKIYESTDEGVTWADSTPAAGAALTHPGNFFTYESDVIFVCSARAAIKRALGSAAGTDFSNVGGSPPTAICGAQVRQHVVLGGLVGVDNYAIQTSAIGDHEDWPTPGSADAQAKESIREVLPQSLGLVRAVLGGEKIGIVVQESGLTRMTYEGGDTVYTFDTFESKVGFGYTRQSYFVSDGSLWYWYNDSGFYATDGYSVNHLDDGKIEAAFFLDLLSHGSKSSIPPTYCPSAYDAHRHLMIFGNHEADIQLAYNPTLGAFQVMSEAQVTGPFVGRSTNGATLVPKTYGPTVYNINQSSRKLQSLSAIAQGGGVIQTGYIELSPGYRFQLEGATVLGSGDGTVDDLVISYKTAAKIADCDVSQSGFTQLSQQSIGEKWTSRAATQYIAFRIVGPISEVHLFRGIRVYFRRAEPAP